MSNYKKKISIILMGVGISSISLAVSQPTDDTVHMTVVSTNLPTLTPVGITYTISSSSRTDCTIDAAQPSLQGEGSIFDENPFVFTLKSDTIQQNWGENVRCISEKYALNTFPDIVQSLTYFVSYDSSAQKYLNAGVANICLSGPGYPPCSTAGRKH